MATTTITHTHTNLDSSACPFAHSGENLIHIHGWCPKQPGDSRSPCPAINTLANHGYIKRSGRSVGFWELVSALRKAYGLSYPLVLFITFGGFLLLHHWNVFRPLDLEELRRHNRVEHNASLVHDDVKPGEDEASTEVDSTLIDTFFNNVLNQGYINEKQDMDLEHTVDIMDVARARVRREAQSGAIDDVHKEIARGEMGIILGVWEAQKLGLSKAELAVPAKGGVPLTWLREWFTHERLPAEWQTRVQSGAVGRTGLLETMKRSSSIRETMKSLMTAH